MKLCNIARFVIRGVAFLLMVGVGLGLKPLHAQTSFGTILGTVTDPSQAAIPAVAITVTNNQTGIVRHAETDAVGSYRVESILPGTYTVRAEHAGFQMTDVTNTNVPVAVIVTVNIVMQVGTVTQTIEVTAAAPLLQTSTATVGTVVNNTSVVTLPLNGRNFTELIGLVPGAVSSGGAIYGIAGGQNYSVSGNRGEQNNFTLDGAYNNEEMFKTYAIQPSIDALQEFKIQTNITSAEYGQAAGANINVAVKSGSNQIHGSGFEFYRGTTLDANDWFRNNQGLKRPRYNRNQYGGTLGGPFYIPHVYNGRDRSFWFFNYEGTKWRQGSSSLGVLPTAAQLSGDLRDQQPIYDPLTTTQTGVDKDGNPIYSRQQICDPAVGPCTPGGAGLNHIPANRIDPWVAAYLDVFYPKVTAPAGAHQVYIINPAPFTQDAYQWTIRADQKLRENLSFFARMSLADATQISAQALPGLNTPLINNYRNAVASWTLVANPTTVIDWKVGFNRTNIQTYATDPAPGWAAFLAAHPISGTPIKSAAVPLFPQLQFPGSSYSTAYQEGFPFVENEYQVMGALSKIKGKHSIKAGMEFMDFRALDDGNFTSIFYFYPTATADPQNVGSTGSVLASLLLGLPGDGLRNLGETEFYSRQTRWQPYLQDDIKITRKLTLNLGLRYEYNQWPVERWDRMAGFDPTTPPNGMYLWSGYNQILKQGPNVRRGIRDPDFNNFAPRIGLAYEFKPNTTFRAGYSIFYTANYMWEDQGERGNWPFAISQSLTSINTATTSPTTPQGGTNTHVGLVPITNFFTPDILPGPDSVESSQHVLGRKDRTSYAQQWNAGVQRMLTSTLMLEVDYVGSRGVKGSLFTNLNTALPGPGSVGTAEHPRIYGNQYGAMSIMSNLASSSYNSLQIKLEKRFANGLQFLSSYAWAHYFDIGGSCFSCSSAPQDPFNWQADKADGNFDFRHIWAFNYFYQLPFGKGRKFLTTASGPLNQIVTGWELTGIIHYNTGGPMGVGYPGDVANIGGRAGAQRPNWVGGASRRVLNPNDRRLGWLNMANYAPPIPYTFGNAGRNLERGPGAGYFNPGILKNFPLHGEGTMLQFRAEFFNMLNQHAMGCISSSYGATDFGTANCTQQSSRDIQFGLKLLF